MPFIDSARETVNRLPQGNQMRVVLEFLLQHGLGHHHAQPWKNLEAHLNDNQIYMTQEKFQQTILKESRAGDIFIGSNDHGVGRGYFIIQDREDVAVAREFYTRRIAAQQENLNRLEDLVQRHQFS